MHPKLAETRLKALEYMKPTPGCIILGNHRFNIADESLPVSLHSTY